MFRVLLSSSFTFMRCMLLLPSLLLHSSASFTRVLLPVADNEGAGVPPLTIDRVQLVCDVGAAWRLVAVVRPLVAVAFVRQPPPRVRQSRVHRLRHRDVGRKGHEHHVTERAHLDDAPRRCRRRHLRCKAEYGDGAARVPGRRELQALDDDAIEPRPLGARHVDADGGERGQILLVGDAGGGSEAEAQRGLAQRIDVGKWPLAGARGGDGIELGRRRRESFFSADGLRRFRVYLRGGSGRPEVVRLIDVFDRPLLVVTVLVARGGGGVVGREAIQVIEVVDAVELPPRGVAHTDEFLAAGDPGARQVLRRVPAAARAREVRRPLVPHPVHGERQREDRLHERGKRGHQAPHREDASNGASVGRRRRFHDHAGVGVDEPRGDGVHHQRVHEQRRRVHGAAVVVARPDSSAVDVRAQHRSERGDARGDVAVGFAAGCRLVVVLIFVDGVGGGGGGHRCPTAAVRCPRDASGEQHDVRD
mmetsp:Transcript_16648/g.51633  ORF Transcript_16648/g.51633 Transcript_16648/m.51633 type:complete len:476 (+) Transcript_16648:649-2076(+)